jgi:hypothetical protein
MGFLLNPTSTLIKFDSLEPKNSKKSIMHKCDQCEKSFSRSWSLSRHKKSKHNDSEDSEMTNDSETEESGTDSSDNERNGVESEESTNNSDTDNNDTEDSGTENSEAESEDAEIMTTETINCLLHMLGAAELGKLTVTTESLRCFISSDCSNDEKEESDDGIEIENSAIRFLKDLLFAAKDEKIVLKTSLYFDILDAIDEVEM